MESLGKDYIDLRDGSDPRWLSDSPEWRSKPVEEQQLILEEVYPAGGPWTGHAEVGYLSPEDAEEVA